MPITASIEITGEANVDAVAPAQVRLVSGHPVTNPFMVVPDEPLSGPYDVPYVLFLPGLDAGEHEFDVSVHLVETVEPRKPTVRIEMLPAAPAE